MQRCQSIVPALLEFAGHQTVVRIDRVILALSQLNLEARSFEPELPLVIQGLALALQDRQGRQGGFELGRLDRLQKDSADGLIEISHSKRLALRLIIGDLLASAHIGRGVCAIRGGHATSAPATDQNAL